MQYRYYRKRWRYTHRAPPKNLLGADLIIGNSLKEKKTDDITIYKCHQRRVPHARRRERLATGRINPAGLPAVPLVAHCIMKHDDLTCTEDSINKINKLDRFTGAYILENTTPPPWGREYQPMSFGGKIWKDEQKKGENVKEKGRKGKKRKEG
jgi:hypothetical protein